MATIIRQKQFNTHVYTTEVAGRPLKLEIGKVAELANDGQLPQVAPRVITALRGMI